MLGALFPSCPMPHGSLGSCLRLLFTASSLASENGIPSRQLGYMLAFQSLRPHRVAHVASLSAAAAAREPLFFNLDALSPDGVPSLVERHMLCLPRASIEHASVEHAFVAALLI